MTPTQTQTKPTIEIADDRENRTAADERDAIRQDIADQLTVRWIPHYEGDPDVIHGVRIWREPEISPNRVVLTIDGGGQFLPLEVEGETDGVRWTAKLYDYAREQADFQVEVSA